MTREAKVGLMMVAVLVGVFGFLIYKRIHQPNEGRAAQTVSNKASVETDLGGPQQQSDDFDAPPARRQPLAVREVEKVEMEADDFADVVVQVTRPNVDRNKLAPPKVESSNDDDFAQFEPPRNTRVKTEKIQSIPIPEPVEDAFDDFREPSTPPRKLANLREPKKSSDPFDDDSATSSPIDYSSAPVRQVKAQAFSDDSNDSAQPEEPQFTRAPQADDATILEEPRRTRDFQNDDDYAPKTRRKPAPMELNDDYGPATNISRAGGAIDGPNYTIQPNDSFWSIARKRYGAGRYYMALALHNRQTIPDPKMMKPGVVISTPDVSFLEENYPNSIPKPAPVDSIQPVSTIQSRRSAQAEPAGFFLSEDGEPMYRVGSRDTLSDIAKTHLGRSSRWVQIQEMNRNVLRDGNELKIGTVLRLPADASRVRVVGTARSFR